MWGMAVLEGKHRDFWQSLEWAAETLTTTGYAADTSWRHPLMVLLGGRVGFLGARRVFLVFPTSLVPFREERFGTRLPQEVPKDLHGHAVIYRYGPAVETLLEELAGAGGPPLVLEGDDPTARRLFERGVRVVHRRLGEGALRAARLESARAVIANGSDDENAALSPSARQLGFPARHPARRLGSRGPTLEGVGYPYRCGRWIPAGARAVFSPRHILGAALAASA